jgi:ABC-2 type transport system ATP-binding protein
MPTSNMIEVENLTKFYGNFPAVTDISFTVKQGEILGFLGPNAAGKTTTMRILTGFMPPTRGRARVAGYDVVTESIEARRRIGYLPETVPLYTDMTVEGYLAFMGSIRGMSRKHVQNRIDDVIDTCKLQDYPNTLIGKLSKGYRQRVGIAQAILHEPEVLILDEPTIGIDPIQVVETRQLIKGLGGEHTVILSSHILPEVSMVCNRVLVIHEGQVVAIDHPARLSERLQSSERVELEARGPAAGIIRVLKNIPGVQDVTSSGSSEKGKYLITAARGTDLREQIAQKITEKGWGLIQLQSLAMSLEEIFLELTGREDA